MGMYLPQTVYVNGPLSHGDNPFSHCDDIAFSHSKFAQHISNAAHLTQQLLECDMFHHSWLVTLPNDGHLVTALGNMTVDTVGARIDLTIQKPSLRKR
jgi:hypothetical protein